MSSFHWWRSICLALLLANGLFFVGARWLAAPAGVSQTLPKELARIALASEVPPRPRRCITVGPFRESREIAAASNLLREVGYVPRSREISGEFADGYVVLVADIRSTSQLTRTMSRLRRGGIRDAAVLPNDAPGIVLSAGLFRELQAAQQRADMVRKLGLQADVMERLASGTTTWLDIDLRASGEDLDPSTFRSDGSLQIKPCPSAS